MARTPKFEYKKTPSGWMVNVPASLSETGKRERHFFKTRDLAKAHAKELKEKYKDHGANATIIRPSLAEDAVKAELILKPWGISLPEAARRIADAMKKANASKPFDLAIEAWEQTFDNKRPRTVQNYMTTITRVKPVFGSRRLSVITADEITSGIKGDGMPDSTYEQHRKVFRVFWNWCAKKGWCEKEVFAQVEESGRRPDSEIEFLSVYDVKELLQTAETHYPQAVPIYAIGFFAGVRAEELNRLREEDVTLEVVNLPVAVAKKRRRRSIAINKTLAAWLKVYPFERCSNWREVDRTVRRLAGWDVATTLVSKPPKPTKGRWPQNAIRHSHATYAIASGVSLDKMLFEFGHVGGTHLLKEHYVGGATKKQAVEFFQLRPSRS